MKRLYLSLILIIIAFAGIIYVNAEASPQQLEERVNVMENSLRNDYVAVDNRVAILKSEINALRADIDEIKAKEQMSSLKDQWVVYALFLCLIAISFVLNVTTMIRMRSLRPTTSKQIVKLKQDNLDRLKQYVNYCRFQKGMSIVDCKKELLSKGWTEDQLKDVMQ